MHAPRNEADSRPRLRLRLLDECLREQRHLTVVERFANQHHETGAPGVYRDLIPLERPQAWQQYGF